MGKLLYDYSTVELLEHLSGRDFTEKTLSDFRDFEIENEYESRGLAEPEKVLEDYSDDEIEDEYKSRLTLDEDELTNLVNDINSGKETYTRVISYLERVSGKLITKPLK